MVIDAPDALRWAARVACCGVMLQSLELAMLWREFGPRRLLGVQEEAAARDATAMIPPFACSCSATLAVLLGRSVAAAAVVWGANGAAAPWLLAALLGCQLFYILRFPIVLTNADHMNLVVLSAVTVGLLPATSEALRTIALGFLAFQSLWAYATSGVEKMWAPQWRSGVRLAEVFQDSPHRFAPLGAYFSTHRNVAKLAAWAVIVGECLFPLSLFLPKTALLVALGAGVLFHAIIAVTMGLPSFFWAFVATYPALYFFNGYVGANPTG